MQKTVIPLSVIICTYNRAGFLRMVLDSLVNQTLPQDKYELIIIDDGSSDNTRQVIEPFQKILPIKYFFQNNAGLASAKNHGIYAAQGTILLFLDDDDVATPALLEEHLIMHRNYPEDNYAVLHYTKWAPNLTVTPVMHFVTEIGCFLFSYPYLKHGSVIDYTYFWGGRSSCKRAFLIEHGVFNPVFRFGCEDIELGYRLSLHGLKVVYNSRAVSLMIRPVTFDDFCRRLIKQGRSQYVFSTLHNNPDVHKWAEIPGAEEQWQDIKDIFDVKMRSASELDRIANMKMHYKLVLDDLTRGLLYKAYWWIFRACKIKGIMEAKEEAQKKDQEEQDKKAPNTGQEFSVSKEKHDTATDDLLMKTEEHSLSVAKTDSFEGYKEYLAKNQSELDKRKNRERSFIVDSKPFSFEGHCYVCRKNVQFSVDYLHAYNVDSLLTPNWRERMICRSCGMNNRMRASVHLFEHLLQPHRQSKIYISEQTTPLYDWLAKNYPHVVGSEYLGRRVPFGKKNNQVIRNEDITDLTFSDNQFDFILSFDVFEHIADYQKALMECFRVLKPEGSLFFTVPFDANSQKNITRAVKKENNQIENLFPPEYHRELLHPKGCLVFYYFGWELLDQLKETGFDKVNAHLYWSERFGYLGGGQMVFIATKSSEYVPHP